MANVLTTIMECLFGTADDHFAHPTEKQSLTMSISRGRTPDEIAIDIVNLLRTVEKNSRKLKRDLDDTVSATAGGWTENIAESVLNKLAELISSENREKLGAAMNEALDKAEEVANGIFKFARDHPVAVAVFCTILAIGVLWFLAPWVLEVLGFAAEGPIEDSFAAWWESTYAGYIPRDSLFSFLQRLAMKWPRIQVINSSFSGSTILLQAR